MTSTIITNNAAQAGRLATDKAFFSGSRFAIAAVHTRFDAVQWFVWDAERLDDDGLAAVIGQHATEEEARAQVGALCTG